MPVLLYPGSAADPNGADTPVVHETDHEGQGVRILPGYLRQQPNVVRLVRVLLRGVQGVEDLAWDLLQQRTLGVAEGAHLDRFGELVNEPRGSLLNDADYRAVIQGRILANACDGSLDSVIGVVQAACAPVVCLEYVPYYPSAYKIQVARDRWMDEARRLRVRRILHDATPSGENGIYVEAIHGGLGPPTSCVGNTTGSPVSRII